MTASDEEEMPVLFMAQLPSNYRQNAQLAAMATFMSESDEEVVVDGCKEAVGAETRRRHQRQAQSTRMKRRPGPYVKLVEKDTASRLRTKGPDDTLTDTKELQVFLSLFQIS